MDQVKEAFTKVKQDILILQEELFFVKKEIGDLKSLILEMVEISKQALVERKKEQEATSEYLQNYPTHPENNPTFIEKIPTEKVAFKPLKAQNKGISIGNDGVPTDKPTDNQTDKKNIKTYNFGGKDNYLNILSNFEKAQMIISSLDDVKKDIRKTFKNLTHQEMLVFSTLYSYEDQNYENIDYKIISNKLNLSESSIRDYINKLIKKGIPITKKRLNNKKIILSIAPTLKEITNLSTIIKLRDL